MKKLELLRCVGCLLGGLVYLAFIDPWIEKYASLGDKPQ